MHLICEWTKELTTAIKKLINNRVVYLEWRQRVRSLHRSDRTETASRIPYQNQRTVKIFSLITLSAIIHKAGKLKEWNFKLMLIKNLSQTQRLQNSPSCFWMDPEAPYLWKWHFVTLGKIMSSVSIIPWKLSWMKSNPKVKNWRPRKMWVR